MGYTLVWGCFFIASSPNLAALWKIYGHAHLLVVLVLSAFIWLCSVLLSSALLLLPGLNSSVYAMAAVSVLAQEGGRLLYYKWFRKAQAKLKAFRPPVLFTQDEEVMIAFASGLGVAIVHSCTYYLTLLSRSAAASGSTFFMPECPNMSLFASAAVTSCCFSLLHIALMPLFFSQCKASEEPYHKGMAWAPAAHAVASALTMLGQAQGGCNVVIVVLPIFSLAVCGYAARDALSSLAATSRVGGGDFAPVSVQTPYVDDAVELQTL